jgi:hypothetical protein
MGWPALEVADIFRTFGTAWRQKHHHRVVEIIVRRLQIRAPP